MVVDAPVRSAQKKAKYVTLSVQKALRILQVFSMERSEQSLMEIASATHLSVSTTHRLLATLEAEGFVERVPGNGLYRLAIKMFELGSVVLHGMEINVAGTPILAKLSTETGETTYLTVLSGDVVLCVARIEGMRYLRSEFLAVGRHLPIHAGAASKVFLASLPEQRARDLLTRYSLIPYTEKTITDPEEIIQSLPQIREQGYALSEEEITKGIAAIAAPIRDQTGQIVAAISLSSAASRFGPTGLPYLVERLQEAAYDISVRLGYVPRFIT